LAVIYVIAVCLAYLLNAAWSEYIRAHGVEIVVVLGVLLAVALLARSKPIDKLIRATTPERLRGWVSWLALLYVVAVSIAYLLSDTFADYLQAHWPRILAVLITLLAIACFTRHLTPSFVRGILPLTGDFLFREAARRTVKSRADMRWGPDRRGFRRLLHPNGVCMFGKWEITAESGYTGYFQPGSTGLIGKAGQTGDRYSRIPQNIGRRRSAANRRRRP
jgi:branched-subunit amino acid transport protein